MSTHRDLKRYDSYMEEIPPRVQEAWLEYYGSAFSIDHIGEALIYDLSNKKMSRDRASFLTNWFINAKKEVRQVTAQLVYASDIEKKKSDTKTMEENAGYF